MKSVEMPADLQQDAAKLKVLKMPGVGEIPFQRNKDGSLKNTPTNAQLLIEHDEKLSGLLAFNEFTQSVKILKNIKELRIKKGTFNSVNLINISGYLEREYNIFFKKDILRDGILLAAGNHTFNPVLDRINAEKWDGVKRVETFFIDFLGAANTAYVRQVTRKWLTGAVARALHPGIKFELMPVLIGGQGIGKSTLCGSLCPEYFLDNLPSLSGVQKDNLMLIKDSWVVEVAELSAMSKTAIESTKAFISTKVDKYKAPYAAEIDEHPRRCVFIGTTNEVEFLKDKTGNRRFLPIECQLQPPTKNVFKIKKSYILQLLAEAKVLYQAGEKLYLDKQATRLLEEVQENNYVSDPLEESIKQYLNMLVPSDWDDYTTWQRRNYFVRYYDNSQPSDRSAHVLKKEDLYNMDKITTMEIIQVVLNTDSRGIMTASRGSYGKKINLIMNANKQFNKGTIRVNGKIKRGWKRK